MSVAEQAANESYMAAKNATKTAAKTSKDVFKFVVKQLNKNAAEVEKNLQGKHEKSMENFEKALGKLQDQGVISNENASRIKDTVKNDLGSFKGIEDGCCKTGALDSVTDSLNNFKKGDNVEALRSKISDICNTPDVIKSGRVPESKEFSKLVDSVKQKSTQKAMQIKDECGINKVRSKQILDKSKNISFKSKNAQNAVGKLSKTAEMSATKKIGKAAQTAQKAVKNVAKKGAKTAAKAAAKGATTAALGACTFGVGAVVKMAADVALSAAKAAKDVVEQTAEQSAGQAAGQAKGQNVKSSDDRER